MTPPARAQAAIEVLDRVVAGEAAERALTAWGRRARFAGSGDRRAVRDHVYDALRRLRSSAWLGGAGDVAVAQMTGRAILAGLLRGRGVDPAAWFDGSRHGPAPLGRSPEATLAEAPEGVRLDVPDWLLPELSASLGADVGAVCEALRHRAPVVLRANAVRVRRDALARRLRGEGFETVAHPLAANALEVVGPGHRVAAGAAFAEGLFEMQDAGSQALVDRLPLAAGMRVLDLCAGGGGKALAMAAREPAIVLHAHDVDPGRLAQLPARAHRAGAAVALPSDPAAAAPYDLVVCDVPCSGSGAWRRQPDARWRLTPAALDALGAAQDAILARAATLVRPGGVVAYMTCSLLARENDRPVAAAAALGLDEVDRWRCTPLDGADGFFLWAGRSTGGPVRP